jgi:hypothetical protein
VSDQQSQQIALVYKLSSEAGLQIRGSEQELLAACFSIQDACSILLTLIANMLVSLGLAAHISNGLITEKYHQSVAKAPKKNLEKAPTCVAFFWGAPLVSCLGAGAGVLRSVLCTRSASHTRDTRASRV